MIGAKESRGAALLVALLVAALVAVIATKVGSQYILSFRRGSNMLLGDQGYLYLLSAEALAKNVLIADEDPEVDHLGEAWAQQVQPYVIDGGLLTGQIYDLQGRFNLNNLLTSIPVDSSLPFPRTEEQGIFARLLRTFEELEISEQQAQEITEALVDWLDEDSTPTGFYGAEDDYYAELEIPYRAANTAMVSATELRLVKGMTPQLYQALLPHITALPGDITKININTATVNVLRAIAPNPGNPLEPQSLSVIQETIEKRQEELTIKREDLLGDVKNSSEVSSYFLFDGLVKLGDLTMPMQSVLHRPARGGAANQAEVTVTRRSLGSL